MTMKLTKKQKAKNIVQRMAGKGRKAILAALVKMGLKPTSASTYYQNINSGQW